MAQVLMFVDEPDKSPEPRLERWIFADEPERSLVSMAQFPMFADEPERSLVSAGKGAMLDLVGCAG